MSLASIVEVQEPVFLWEFVVVDKCQIVPFCVPYRLVSRKRYVLLRLTDVSNVQWDFLAERGDSAFRRLESIVIDHDYGICEGFPGFLVRYADEKTLQHMWPLVRAYAD